MHLSHELKNIYNINFSNHLDSLMSQVQETKEQSHLQKENEPKQEKQDVKMKEQTEEKSKEIGRMEESKGEISSGLMSGDFWKDWQNRMWEDYNRIEKDLNKKFEEFNDRMFKNRKLQLEEKQKEQEGRVATKAEGGGELQHMSYLKERRQVDSNEIIVDGHRMLFRTLDYSKERDGVLIPHILKQVYCHPAISLDLLKENSFFKESIDKDKEQRVLSQFENDIKNVPEH